jgi:hypothetical protein
MFLSGVIVSLPMLLMASGVAAVAFGTLLAVRNYKSGGHDALQIAAGLLLIAGFSCFGVGLSFVYGAPVP